MKRIELCWHPRDEAKGVLITTCHNRQAYLRHCKDFTHEGKLSSGATSRACCYIFARPDKDNHVSEIVFDRSDLNLDTIVHECVHALLHFHGIVTVGTADGEELFCARLGEMVDQLTERLLDIPRVRG